MTKVRFFAEIEDVTTYVEALRKIQKHDWITPCDEALQAINLHIKTNKETKKRTFSLWYLKPKVVLLDGVNNLGKPLKDKFCAWCGVKKLKGKQQKYCSKNCSESAFMFSNPQSPHTKMWILINKQNCGCALCGISYENLVIEQVNKQLKVKRRVFEFDQKWIETTGFKLEVETSYFAIGDCTGHIIQVDHKVPIFKGGSAVGLDNIQVVCSGCHAIKTASERSNDESGPDNG